MKASCLKWYAVTAVLVFGPVGLRMLCWERTKPHTVDREMAKSGEELFNHAWQIKDPLSADGDGLGPVFNARSCVACHNQGGPGGGGDVEHNVTTYVIRPVNGKGEPREGFTPTPRTKNIAKRWPTSTRRCQRFPGFRCGNSHRRTKIRNRCRLYFRAVTRCDSSYPRTSNSRSETRRRCSGPT